MHNYIHETFFRSNYINWNLINIFLLSDFNVQNFQITPNLGRLKIMKCYSFKNMAVGSSGNQKNTHLYS